MPGQERSDPLLTESATENRPPLDFRGVRVKRWGKSPPRSWRHGRHGKPRLEQGQVSGESTHLDQDAAGRLLEGVSDRTPREMTVTVVHSTGQNPAYRLVA